MRKKAQESRSVATKEPIRISPTAIAMARVRRNVEMFDVVPLPLMNIADVWKIPPCPPGVGPQGKQPSLAMDESISTGLYSSYAAASMYQEGLGFFGYPYLAQLTQRSEYRRASSVMAEEMTRKWGKVVSTGEDKGKEEVIKQIEAEFSRLKVQEKIREAIEQDLTFGRGQLFVDFGDTRGEELSKPLVAKKEKVVRPIKQLTLVDPMWTYPNTYNSTNPLEDDFYKPSLWYVMATPVHASRLLQFVSFPVPDLLKPAYLFGGISLTQQIKPYVDNWLKTRQDVQQVIHSFITYVLKTDMSQALSGMAGEREAARSELFNAYKSSSDLLMISKETEDFVAVSAPLGSLDKLQAQALEHICSAAGQPVIKYTGISPSGLNTSSQEEIDVFYDHVAACQEKDPTRAIQFILELVQLGLGLEVDPEITWSWLPLKEMTAKEMVDIDKAEADADAIYITNGILSPLEARTRLANKEDSPYMGLDVDDLPELPEQPAHLDEDVKAQDAMTQYAFLAQVKKGLDIEREHLGTVGGNEEEIIGIVLDHLKESLDYYDRLEKMERGFAADKQNPDEKWITTETGAHLLLNGEGVIIGGAGGKFNGKKISEISKGSKKEKEPDKTRKSIPAGSKKKDYAEILTKTQSQVERFKGKSISNNIEYIHMAVREASTDKKVSLSLKYDEDGDIIGAASYYPEKDSVRVSLLGGVGGGSAVLSDAIEESKKKGFGGAITLTPLRDINTINWYINAGFDAKKGSVGEFWLSPEEAEGFLKRGKK